MSVVYFIRSGATPLVKIGHAIDLKARIASLQCGNPAPLSVLAVIAGDHALEKAFHRALRAHRIRNEWFDLDATMALVDHVQSQDGPAEEAIVSYVGDRKAARLAAAADLYRRVRAEFSAAVETLGFEAVQKHLGYTRFGLAKILNGASKPCTFAIFQLDEIHTGAIQRLLVDPRQLHAATGNWIAKITETRSSSEEAA